MEKTHASRVGYGRRVKTNGTNCNVKPIKNSRYIIPMRMRIKGETFNEEIRCAKDLKSAKRVEELQKMTAVFPDID